MTLVALLLINLCLDEVGVLFIAVVGIIAWELIEHGMVFGQ